MVFALAALAMVPTLWPVLDLQVAAWFAGPGTEHHIIQWWWVELINLYVPSFFRGVVLVALVGWIAASLRPASAVLRWRPWCSSAM